MEIKKIVSLEMDQNCYLLYENNKGILIDPGHDAEKILKECEGISIEYILLTHCHYDHIESLDYIKEVKNAKVVASENCSENIQDSYKNVSEFFGKKVTFEKADITLSDGEVFTYSDFDIKCIHTPGHTNCSVCYIVDNHVFSGDTLFHSNIGRWDLPTADVNELIYSINNKIYKLDDDFLVHPGHGDDTTISREKKFNIYVKADI